MPEFSTFETKEIKSVRVVAIATSGVLSKYPSEPDILSGNAFVILLRNSGLRKASGLESLRIMFSLHRLWTNSLKTNDLVAFLANRFAFCLPKFGDEVNIAITIWQHIFRRSAMRSKIPCIAEGTIVYGT